MQVLTRRAIFLLCFFLINFLCANSQALASTQIISFKGYLGKDELSKAKPILSEIAKSQNTTPVDVYIQIVKSGGAGVVCNSMNEADVKAFYQQSWVMVSSDGGIGSRHPRGTGTFTRVLGKFVRENNWLSLEEAVKKMSSMPAARLGLKDRGLIKKGMKADLILIDSKEVTDNATFASPQTFSTGIRSVFVNGVQVWDGSKSTGSLPGDILKRQ